MCLCFVNKIVIISFSGVNNKNSVNNSEYLLIKLYMRLA